MFIEMDKLCIAMLRECMGWLRGKDISAWCLCTKANLDIGPIREWHLKRLLSAKYLQGNLPPQWMDGVPIDNTWIHDMNKVLERESTYMYLMTIQETADDLLYIQGFPYYQQTYRDRYFIVDTPISKRTTKKLWEYKPTRVRRRRGSYCVDKLFYTSLFGGTGKIYENEDVCAVYGCRSGGYVRRAILRSPTLKAIIN